MNTLADFKRRLKVGAKVATIWHLKPRARDEENNRILYQSESRGTRVVSIVQTNSFAFKTVKGNGEVVDSWCEMPKASECKIEGDQITIYEELRGYKEPQPALTYKFVD